MKIALVHSYYSRLNPSGENAVVDLQARALSEAGHNVQLFTRETDVERSSFAYAARSSLCVATGYGRSPLRGLRAFAPDVVHVHNLFPNYGTRWLGSLSCPLVATLHNYRPICAAATLYRDGRPCTDCTDRGAWHSLRHRCYRDSALATLPLSIANTRSFARNSILGRADSLITLSRRSRDIYLSLGIPPERLALIPNPASNHEIQPRSGRRDHWVFVGRLSPEKGVGELVEKWPDGPDLHVVGDGPLLESLRNRRRPNVRIIGRLPPQEVPDVLKCATGLVFPSRWPEGAPLVYVEALANGLPVLALKGNSVADEVLASHTGVVIDSLDSASLQAGIDIVTRHWTSLSTTAQSAFRTQYSLTQWVTRIESIYSRALNQT